MRGKKKYKKHLKISLCFIYFLVLTIVRKKKHLHYPLPITEGVMHGSLKFQTRPFPMSCQLTLPGLSVSLAAKKIILLFIYLIFSMTTILNVFLSELFLGANV